MSSLEMLYVAVETTEDGYIHIIQNWYMDREVTIEVSPDQVGLLCSWIYEAAREIERGSA